MFTGLVWRARVNRDGEYPTMLAITTVHPTRTERPTWPLPTRVRSSRKGGSIPCSALLYNISIFITILVAVIIYIVLNKTTFGYELKACGFNRNASIYAGINAKRNIVLSMVIAGALSGLGGGILKRNGTIHDRTSTETAHERTFSARSSVSQSLSRDLIRSVLFFSRLLSLTFRLAARRCRRSLQGVLFDIIISVIIYLSAFALLLKGVIRKILSMRKAKQVEGV
jgi:simple sugar transport system permease protein